MAKKKVGPKTGSDKKPKQTRVPIPPEVRIEVLKKCRRRCCICFVLKGVNAVADGQIAHLDQDNTNPQPDNLAFLCLECHKNYDRKSNRVQGYTPEEIKSYRDQLYLAIGPDHFEWVIRIRISSDKYDQIKPLVDSVHTAFRNASAYVVITEGSGT